MVLFPNPSIPILIWDAYYLNHEVLVLDGTKFPVIPAPTPNPLSVLTVEFWIYWSSTDTNEYTTSLLRSNNGISVQLQQKGVAPGTIFFYFGPYIRKFGNYSLPRDTWTHIALTMDLPKQQTSLYVNTELVETQNIETITASEIQLEDMLLGFFQLEVRSRFSDSVISEIVKEKSKC